MAITMAAAIAMAMAISWAVAGAMAMATAMSVSMAMAAAMATVFAIAVAITVMAMAVAEAVAVATVFAIAVAITVMAMAVAEAVAVAFGDEFMNNVTELGKLLVIKNKLRLKERLIKYAEALKKHYSDNGAERQTVDDSSRIELGRDGDTISRCMAVETKLKQS